MQFAFILSSRFLLLSIQIRMKWNRVQERVVIAMRNHKRYHIPTYWKDKCRISLGFSEKGEENGSGSLFLGHNRPIAILTKLIFMLLI
jgi:hypothetical protein